MSKRYTVIGQLNGRWYDMLMKPVKRESDAAARAEEQNASVPDLDCRVVEYNPGQYEYWIDLDNKAVRKHKKHIEDMLSDVSFDNVRPAIVEYRNGFKQPDKPTQKKTPPQPQPQQKRAIPEPVILDRGLDYPRPITSRPVDTRDYHADRHAASMRDIAEASKAVAPHERCDPIGGTSQGYVAPHERGQSGSGTVQLALIMVVVVALATVVFGG